MLCFTFVMICYCLFELWVVFVVYCLGFGCYVGGDVCYCLLVLFGIGLVL